jgi:(2Fe-2S) ferredoxin
MRYKKHVFICTNQKVEGKKCCGGNGAELVNAFRDRLKEMELNTDIRVQPSGCLDACGKGPTMVVYPEGTYYGKVQAEDVEEIIQNHLVNNQAVERLELQF